MYHLIKKNWTYPKLFSSQIRCTPSTPGYRGSSPPRYKVPSDAAV